MRAGGRKINYDEVPWAGRDCMLSLLALSVAGEAGVRKQQAALLPEANTMEIFRQIFFDLTQDCMSEAARFVNLHYLSSTTTPARLPSKCHARPNKKIHGLSQRPSRKRKRNEKYDLHQHQVIKERYG